MNQRIRELWEEATVSTWPRPGKFTAGEYDYHLEKFAELIVRKCAYVSEGYFGFKDHTPGTAIAKEMKEHFGIEDLQPCKSPYCECDVNKCSHPGFYDARGES